MFRSIRQIFIMGLACAIVLTSCSPNTDLKRVVLQIKGVDWGCNITTSYALFGSSSESADDPEIFLPATDGDLLYLITDDNLETYVRYSDLMGSILEVEYDTLKPWRIQINGTVALVTLEEETPMEAVAEDLSMTNTGKLASITIDDSITEKMISGLRSLQPHLGETGLRITYDISAGQLKEVAALCDPDWLAMEYLPSDPESGEAYIPAGLELLWLMGTPPDFSASEESLTDLQSLIIAEWEPGEKDELMLSGLKNLHTLTLAECYITNLNNVRMPKQLRRLHLLDCDTLFSIERLSKVPKLTSLSLTASDSIKSLAPVQGLTGLTHMAFPGNTSQEAFAAVTSQWPLLDEVELINCPGVTDLSPLKDIEHLRILALQVDSILPDQLGSLDQLELIILGQGLFDDSPEKISALRASLPETLIVPGSGLCMGSGWLLLLLPVIILVRVFFKKYEIPAHRR